MTANVQHEQGTDRWYTPADVCERAREVLGGIDLDPASEPEANAIVQAKRIITEKEDARNVRWIDPEGPPLSIFCNPPGKKDGPPSPKTGKPTGRSLVWEFWDRLMVERGANRLRGAIWVAYSLEQLQQSQLRAWDPKTGQLRSIPMTDFHMCIPKRRLAFGAPEGGKTSPTHANAIVLVEGLEPMQAAFARAFRSLGSIVCPSFW